MSFGPSTHNFRTEVAGLLAAEAARVVHNQEELTAFVQWGLEEPALREAMGERAAAVIAAGRGATEATARRLLALLPPRAAE